MQPDACLFVISAYNLSQRRLDELRRMTAERAPCPSMLIRLEGTATALPEALDSLYGDGHRRILIQPMGMPFTESLLAWLPGAAASWVSAQGHDDVDVVIGTESSRWQAVIDMAVDTALANAGEARSIREAKPSLGKPGWQDPPDFIHHLLVCTGPRCHYRDAASLLHALRQETARQGVSGDCLTARTGCLFPCNQGPMVALYPRGEWYRLPDASSVRRFVGEVLVEGRTASDLLIHTAKAVRTPSPSTEDQSA